MLRQVEFMWDDQYGSCYNCGRPAAYGHNIIGKFAMTALKLCSVCAAEYAADREVIYRIDSLHPLEIENFLRVAKPNGVYQPRISTIKRNI